MVFSVKGDQEESEGLGEWTSKYVHWPSHSGQRPRHREEREQENRRERTQPGLPEHG